MAPSLWLADVVTDAFRGSGVNVVVYKGWTTRSAKTTTVDHQGVMGHDTGSQSGSSYAGVLGWVVSGSPIAPLCNIMTGPAGYGGLSAPRIDVIAAGRTNHAGRPDDTWDPFDAWLAGLGNKHMVGVEHFWTPAVEWSRSYVDLQAHLDAALLAHMGAGPDKWVAHREYATGRKQDPRLITDLDGYRRQIAAAMAAPDTEDIMATIEELRAVVREEARAAVEERGLDRTFRNWVDGETEPVRVTLHSIRRDAAAARVAAEQARAVSRELAARGGMSADDLAAIEDAVRDVIADGITITGTITAGEPA